MKIALITLHHVRNVGSLLQTYATQTILEKLGHEVEVVNYIPVGFWLWTGIRTIKKTNNFLKNLMRNLSACFLFGMLQLRMICFNRRYLHLTPEEYNTYEELLHSCVEADAYVVGSDQVWNTQNYNSPDDIKGYYLKFVPVGKKKVAFASSIGKVAFDDGERDEVHNSLKDFSAISVRESHAKALLESIGVRDVKQVLDPTFLLSHDNWEEFESKGKKIQKPYIFVYNLNRNTALTKFAYSLAKEKNMSIVNFTGIYGYMKNANNHIAYNPHNFISCLSGASYVLTDSFHGTAFSINFNKQFLTFPAPKFNSRIDSVLNLFGLKDRLWTSGMEIKSVDRIIDYVSINEILIRERKKTLDFLKFAFDEKGKNV